MAADDDEVVDLPDLDEFETGFAAARTELAELRGEAPDPDVTEAPGTPEAPEAPGTPEIRGMGEAADGLIRVVVRAGGEVESVDIDPRAFRAGAADLGKNLTVAINQALEALARQAVDATDDRLDPRRLAEELEDAQDVAADRASEFFSAYEDAMVKLERRTREG